VTFRNLRNEQEVIVMRRPGFIAGLLHVRFVVEKVALEEAFLLIYSVFTCYSSSYQCFIPIYWVFRAQADCTFILPSRFLPKELRHLPRKMPPRGTTY
jgi:hypothetical protein